MKEARGFVLKAVFAAVLLAALNLGCGEEPGEANQPAAGRKDAASRPAAQDARTLRLKCFRCVDRQGIGAEAFSIVAPADWEFQGEVQWILDRPAAPAAAVFRVRNPKGTEQVELLPTVYFFWTSNQMVLAACPLGSRYFGNEMRPPMRALESIKEMLLPRFRKDAVGLKMVSEERLRDPFKPTVGIPTDANVVSDGARVRVEYDADGTAMEEEIYATVQAVELPMMVGTYWAMGYTFCLRAEKGQLDKSSRTLQTIARSFRLDPQWFNKHNQIVEMLVQNQIRQIQRIGEVSRMVSRTYNEISDMTRRGYEERQAAQDRMFDGFSQAIRGVDEYYNPMEERSVELPTGYDGAWANANGEYILSDNPNFNPNVGSNADWRKLDRRE